ncbi:MAG: hypothetical protein ABF649_22645, partial [Bacillus sp. (in: firmicutes)]
RFRLSSAIPFCILVLLIVTLKLKGALVQQSKLKSRFLERLEIGFFYDWNFLSVVNTHFPDATPCPST